MSDSKGYAEELEKLRRHDSNLILHLYLKGATTKKKRDCKLLDYLGENASSF